MSNFPSRVGFWSSFWEPITFLPTSRITILSSDVSPPVSIHIHSAKCSFFGRGACEFMWPLPRTIELMNFGVRLLRSLPYSVHPKLTKPPPIQKSTHSIKKSKIKNMWFYAIIILQITLQMKQSFDVKQKKLMFVLLNLLQFSNSKTFVYNFLFYFTLFHFQEANSKL